MSLFAKLLIGLVLLAVIAIALHQMWLWATRKNSRFPFDIDELD